MWPAPGDSGDCEVAPRRQHARTPRRAGEKHGWLRFRSHQEIHETALTAYPHVERDETQFTRVEDGATVTVLLSGQVRCTGGVIIEVDKTYEVRRRSGREEIRGVYYRYTARFPGRGNILRYDNGHIEAPDEFHRHEYDLVTWQESSRTLLTRDELPVMTEVIDEVMDFVFGAGLIT